MKRILFFLSTFIACSVCAQNEISGRWTGNSVASIFYSQPRLIEADLEMYQDSLITGVLHIYYNDTTYEHLKLNGKFNRGDSTVQLREDSIISYRVRPTDTIVTGRYDFRLSRANGTLRLEGFWQRVPPPAFNVRLRTWFEKPVTNKDSAIVNAKVAPDVRLTRVGDVQRLIELGPEEMDSIRIDIYDSGEIDNDTVSVFIDDVEVLHHQRISGKPLVVYTSIPKGQKIRRIKLVAENLGTIPPNTALLIVTTRKQRYRLSLSADKAKNGVVELFVR